VKLTTLLYLVPRLRMMELYRFFFCYGATTLITSLGLLDNILPFKTVLYVVLPTS
jgi:hypothetical protein